MDLKSNYSEISEVKRNVTWRLLAADTGDCVIALLKTHLYDDLRFRIMDGSALTVRMADGLEALKKLGCRKLLNSAQYYLNEWAREGYLIRRFPQGATDEEYELSAGAIDAIRMVESLAHPLPTMTESRLALVIDAVAKLSDDTNPDTGLRIKRLQEDIDRRQADLERVKSGHLGVLGLETAKERAKEIASLAEGLNEDFRRVMDEFESLARKFRESVHLSDEPRGAVLEKFFKGYLSLNGTDAGRSFAAFYKLLNDDVQQDIFRSSLKRLREEPFFSALEPREKRILTDIVQDLVLRASAIAAVTSALDESLRKFVEGPEYARSKALAKLLSKAMGLAMEMRGRLNPVAKLSTALNLAPRKFRSVSQLVWAPKPPRTKPEPFRPAEESGADLKEIWEAVNIAEIDFQALKEDILAVLETRESASVAEVLDAFPARQGLASVIGLIHLAHRHGDKNSPARETAAWLSLDGFERSARIETWLFRRSRADELRKSVNDY